MSAAPAHYWGEVQKAQRRASIGISLRHSAHFRLVGSTGRWNRWLNLIRWFMGKTTRKKTAVATRRNVIRLG